MSLVAAQPDMSLLQQAPSHDVTCQGLPCRNVLDVGAYLMQTAIIIMHLGRLELNSNELSVLLAIQVLVLWIKVQYYAR